MEGRIVAVGDEAKPVELELVGLGAKHVALPHVGDDVGLGLGPGDGMGREQTDKKCGAKLSALTIMPLGWMAPQRVTATFLLCPATRC